MTKLYLDLRVVSAVPNPYNASTADLMSYSGANIGNFAFRHALKSLIEIQDYVPVDYNGFNSSIANQPAESVVISCANWLCATEQYEKSNHVRASTIEKANCPIAVFGLGAQAQSGQKDFKLGPNTERLAKIISERSTKVSVRDEFTLTVLEKIGINNAVVTGCPSNFINLNKQLGASIVSKCEDLANSEPEWQNLRMHFSEFSGGHASSGRVLHEIMGLLDESPSFYVIQSPVLFPFILNENDNIPGEYMANKPKSIKTKKDFRRFLKSKIMHFSSIDAWMDFARTCDVSIGMRIHGNMLSLQAGVPSIVIGHDSRTSGLSHAMGIPVVTPETFLENAYNNPLKIVELIHNEMSSYDTIREAIGKTFLDYVIVNGLVPNVALTEFLDKR